MGPGAFQPLRDGLWSDDPIVRRESLRSTGLIDANPEVRREAATALGAFGADATPALPALRKASGDRNEDVAREAGRAILRVQEK